MGNLREINDRNNDTKEKNMELNSTKRINKICKMLLVLIIISVSFTGCMWNNILGTNTQNPLEGGFKFSAPDSPRETPPSPPPRFCAYKSHKSEFNINFVILDFYYGAYYPGGIESELKQGDNFPCFELYFENDDGDRFFVKQVKENYVSEKYGCDVIKKNNSIIEVKFNHSEKLWIPKKLFTKESGVIYFRIYGENPRHSFPKTQTIASIKIYYQRCGNEVLLSDKKFE